MAQETECCAGVNSGAQIPSTHWRKQWAWWPLPAIPELRRLRSDTQGKPANSGWVLGSVERLCPSEGGRVQMLVLSVCWSPHTSVTTRVQTCIHICTPHAHSQRGKKYRRASSRVVFSFCFLVPREDSVGGHLGVRETAAPSFRLVDLVKTLLLGPHSQWCSSFRWS